MIINNIGKLYRNRVDIYNCNGCLFPSGNKFHIRKQYNNGLLHRIDLSSNAISQRGNISILYGSDSIYLTESEFYEMFEEIIIYEKDKKSR